jgi:hypothetical protein
MSCCLVACRHLDEQTRTYLGPRLQKLVESAVANVIFSPQTLQCVEVVQALLILAIWPPGYKKGGIRDSKLLLSTAVNMARDLKLHEASTMVVDLQAAGLSGSQTEIDGLTAQAYIVSHAWVRSFC